MENYLRRQNSSNCKSYIAGVHSPLVTPTRLLGSVVSDVSIGDAIRNVMLVILSNEHTCLDTLRVYATISSKAHLFPKGKRTHRHEE